MSNDITITLGLDTTEAEAEMENFQAQINQTKKELDKTIREGMKSLRSLQRVVGATLNLLKGITKAFGVTLDPLLEAVLQSVMTSITAILGLAFAWNMIPGVGFAIYAAVTAFTLGFGIAATMDIRQKQAATQQQIDGILQSLDAMSSIAGLMGGL